jgi:hypothetical protein
VTRMDNQPPPPEDKTDSPAGWYADPLGSSNQRHWDGAAWTTEIRAAKGATSATGGGADSGWWAANWRYVALTAVGFLVGAVIGASGNNSDTTTSTVTDRNREVTTKTVPKIRTVTETVTAKAAPAEPATSTEPSSTSGEVQTFSGNGGKNLGNIEISSDSTLSWTNDGGVFQIFANEYEVLVNSAGHSGDTFLPTNTYSSMQTNAVGNWTIRIEPK